MKRPFKIIFIIAIAFILAYVFTGNVKMYNENGEVIIIKESKIEEYKADGWYDAPVRTMYLPDGTSSCIYSSETADYESKGWYTEPVTMMYAPQKEMYVKESEIEKYLSEGWYLEPLVAMYDANGSEAYILQSEVETYKNSGWMLYPPEREGLSDLKDAIASYISSRSGNWGVFVKNLKTNEYLSINEKEYSGASLIKLFTMAATYSKINDGSITVNSDVTRNLELMITESNNTSCNTLTALIGGGSTIQGFKNENAHTASIGCKHTTHNSELVDGHGKVTFVGFNRTSPMDCGMVLEKIYRNELVSPEYSAQMLDLLLRQTRTWKIPASLPEGTVVANKTGETDTAQADAAIVYSPACDYVICVIGNGSVGSGVATIQEVSRITYRYFNP